MTVTISPVYTGTTSNDGTGDTLQTAFNKVNTSLFNLAGNLNPLLTPGLATTYANSAYGVFANLSITNAVLGAVNFTTTPTVNGSPVATSAQSFTGGYVSAVAIFGSNLVANSATASGNVSTGALVVIGGAGVSGNLNAGGNVVIGGNLSVVSGADSSSYNTGSFTTAGGLGVQKNANFSQNIYVGGAGQISGTLSLPSSSASHTISSTTSSTNSASGALVVSGGVGVGGNLNVGGTITVSNITVSGTLTSNLSGVITTSFLDLNTPLSQAPLSSETVGNIGIVMHYYDGNNGGDGHAFFGRVATPYSVTGYSVQNYGVLANALTYFSAASDPLTNGGNVNGIQLGTIAGGVLYAGNTTPSTSTSTGALLINGGAGIAGNINVGGNLFVSGSTSTGALLINGGAGIAGNINVGGNLFVSGNIIPSSNATSNIGSSTAWFNTIYGTSTHAQYADLAENYLTDQIYEPGTVVVVGGDAEVTACTDHGQDNVIGAISTDPAYLMNGAAGGQPIALKGRIPLKVYGPIQKGQRLSTSHETGHAEFARGDYSFAIALETDISMGSKIIEAIIL
jgi:hypothetical protein